MKHLFIPNVNIISNIPFKYPAVLWGDLMNITADLIALLDFMQSWTKQTYNIKIVAYKPDDSYFCFLISWLKKNSCENEQFSMSMIL